MSQTEEKILCALLDGVHQSTTAKERESLVKDAMALLQANPPARDTLRRHHLMQSLLRGETDGLTPAMVSGELHDNIMQAVTAQSHASGTDTVVAINAKMVNIDDSRDSIKAHIASTDGSKPDEATVSTLHRETLDNTAVQPRRAGNDDATWWKPAAAFAVAASVVAVALFAWNPSDLVDTPGLDTSGRTVAIRQPDDNSAGTAIFDEESGFTTPGTVWASVNPDDGGIRVDTEVDIAGQSYLNMLLVEHGSATAMNGLSTYAKFVSFDAATNR